MKFPMSELSNIFNSKNTKIAIFARSRCIFRTLMSFQYKLIDIPKHALAFSILALPIGE